MTHHVFSIELLVSYTWKESGKHKKRDVRKILFTKFVNIVDLFFEVLSLADKTFTRAKNEELFKYILLKYSILRLKRKTYKVFTFIRILCMNHS